MMTDNVKYYLWPSMVFNKVKHMHKKFISEYINKDYIHEFPQPTTFVSYYNLDMLEHDVNQQPSHSRERVNCCNYLGWSVYDPSLNNPHTLIFNAVYSESWNDDDWHDGQSVDVNTILHEFAHYINKCDHVILRDIIERHNGNVDVDTILSEKQLRYTDYYNIWDITLKQDYNKFLTTFYNDNNKHIDITYNEFYRMCNMSYEHLSFDFYRACYLCWRLYWEQPSGCKKSKNKRSNYPMFIFKDILGYDGCDEQLIQLTVDASRR